MPSQVGDQDTARAMSIRFQSTVTDGTARGPLQSSTPRRLAWLGASLVLLVMRRRDQQNMHRIKMALESSAMKSA